MFRVVSFYFLFTCALWVLSRFGGIFVVCGSFIHSSVRFCGRLASSGWSERFDLVPFVQFTFISFAIFIVCGFRWSFFRSDLVLVGTCSFRIHCCELLICSCVHLGVPRPLGRLNPRSPLFFFLLHLSPLLHVQLSWDALTLSTLSRWLEPFDFRISYGSWCYRCA